MSYSSKKMYVCVTLCCVLAPLLLAGCGLNNDGGANTITLMHQLPKNDPQGVVLQQVIQQFEQQTGITIQQDIEGNDVSHQVYETDSMAGIEPDINMTNLSDKSLNWFNYKATVDVAKMAQQWGIQQKLIPEAVKEWQTPQGNLQALPFSGFKWPAWYNMDILHKAGIAAPPTTVDELVADAQKVHAIGKELFVAGGSDWSGEKVVMPIMQSTMSDSEAEHVYATGSYCSNADAMKGLELFVRLRDAGVFSKSTAGLTSDQMDTDFYQGQAAMMFAGSWAYAATPPEIAKNVVLGGLPLTSDSPHARPTAYVGYTSTAFWITPNGAKKLDLVQKFIQFMYSPDVMQKFVQSGMVPAAQMPASAYSKTNALLATSMTGLDQKVTYMAQPDLSVPGDIMNGMVSGTSLAYTNGSAQQVCKAMEGAYK